MKLDPATFTAIDEAILELAAGANPFAMAWAAALNAAGKDRDAVRAELIDSLEPLVGGLRDLLDRLASIGTVSQQARTAGEKFSDAYARIVDTLNADDPGPDVLELLRAKYENKWQPPPPPAPAEERIDSSIDSPTSGGRR